MRDQTDVSKTAAERPKLQIRQQCDDDPAPDYERSIGLSGGHHEHHSDEACARFNRQLREGHGGRNSGDE